ncbi:hypothetical protein ACIP5Y_28050 [Nocardia sp. NPDC088792]|uniref:hypothetical protein n=1 Tax=Nocardia sp. NPDC088792 TaxID=3364332 RepID=UPI0038151C5F
MSLRKPCTVVVAAESDAEVRGIDRAIDWDAALEYLPSIGSAYLRRREPAVVVPAACWPAAAPRTAGWELCVPDEEYSRFAAALGLSPEL